MADNAWDSCKQDHYTSA